MITIIRILIVVNPSGTGGDIPAESPSLDFSINTNSQYIAIF